MAFSGSRLLSAIPELEKLMTSPEEIRHVPKLLAACGVRIVVVEPIPGSEIQGVCFWINDDKSPVIGLTLKRAIISTSSGSTFGTKLSTY